MNQVINLRSITCVCIDLCRLFQDIKKLLLYFVTVHISRESLPPVDLERRIQIPRSLAEVGVKEDQFPELAVKAYADPCHQTNARPCTEENLLMLYKEAFSQQY